MTCLVIGLGSMGRRRIRLIKQYDERIRIIGVDMQESRRQQSMDEFGIETCMSIEEAIKKHEECEAAFVCTSPLAHSKVIEECLNNDLHVFSEINLVADGYEENIIKAKEKGKLLFLSSTFLYRKEVEYINKAIAEKEDKKLYRYHIGQYLPDWHPWENYKDYFVSNKRSNACRELFAIELPWLVKSFGQIEKVHTVFGNATSLDLDFPDYYMVLVEHANGNMGTITIDVVSRKAVRNFEVYNEKLHIMWDGTPNGLYDFDINTKELKNVSLYDSVDKLSGYSENIIENAYFGEVSNFFECIKDKENPRHTFEEDLAILKTIDEIEQGI